MEMYIRLLSVRPGQQAQGGRCWQQERAGRAGTATGISRDRLSLLNPKEGNGPLIDNKIFNGFNGLNFRCAQLCLLPTYSTYYSAKYPPPHNTAEWNNASDLYPRGSTDHQ